jgi:hypothetical protein
VITKIGVLEQAENPRLVNERERGGVERPAGKPPGGLESPAITRAAWRFDALTQRCYLAPLPSARDWGLGGRPPTGARCCRRGDIISRGHNGRSGWFWRFQLHPMRPGDNCRRLGHAGWAQGTPEQIGKSPHCPLPQSSAWRVLGVCIAAHSTKAVPDAWRLAAGGTGLVPRI